MGDIIEASLTAELEYLATGKTSDLFPSAPIQSKDACESIMAYCEANKGEEFFGPECAFANQWLTKKENKGKKDKPKK